MKHLYNLNIYDLPNDTIIFLFSILGTNIKEICENREELSDWMGKLLTELNLTQYGEMWSKGIYTGYAELRNISRKDAALIRLYL